MYFEFNNISYAYGDTQALNNVTFCGDKGEVIGLIGENGAGKSTAIKNIVRYLTPNRGTIKLDGRDIFKMKDADFPVSYIPDTPVYYEELSLLEHLHFTKAIFPGCPVSIGEMIDRFDLSEHLNKIPSALSKGSQQKLMIAMALLREYDMLIADEPFTGLDPKQIAILKQTLLEQKKLGKLVLISTHLLDMVENICDRYAVIRKGKLIATGSKAELLTKVGLPGESTVESAYLRLVEMDE